MQIQTTKKKNLDHEQQQQQQKPKKSPNHSHHVEKLKAMKETQGKTVEKTASVLAHGNLVLREHQHQQEQEQLLHCHRQYQHQHCVSQQQEIPCYECPLEVYWHYSTQPTKALLLRTMKGQPPGPCQVRYLLQQRRVTVLHPGANQDQDA